jgi:hypothetical protein
MMETRFSSFAYCMVRCFPNCISRVQGTTTKIRESRHIVEAREALGREDIEGVERLLRDHADAGEIDAEELPGSALMVLAPARREDAIRFLEHAASAGSGLAAHNLGTLYGLGPTPDREKGSGEFTARMRSRVRANGLVGSVVVDGAESVVGLAFFGRSNPLTACARPHSAAYPRWSLNGRSWRRSLGARSTSHEFWLHAWGEETGRNEP